MAKTSKKDLERMGRSNGLTVEVTRHGLRLDGKGLLGIVGLLAVLVMLLLIY